MEAEQTLQDIRDGFALTARNNFKPSLANDMTDISYLIQNAQNALTLAAQGHEESNNTEKVSVSMLQFSKKKNWHIYSYQGRRIRWDIQGICYSGAQVELAKESIRYPETAYQHGREDCEF